MANLHFTDGTDAPRELRYVDAMGALSTLRQRLAFDPGLGISVDVGRIPFETGFWGEMQPRMERALRAMQELEAGAVANQDEQRRVGHYWLRAPELAPEPELRSAIDDARAQVAQFARDVHAGTVTPQSSSHAKFLRVLVIGIGGSSLGPRFVSEALTERSDRMLVHFFDNTDPNGMQRELARIGDDLPATLCVVISKSGGTKETRNGMLIARQAYEARGLSFGRHAVAVTGEGSALDAYAVEQSFLARFPMWDWVGGRTSETSAVGLLPAALQGLDIDGMLAGAAAMDRWTRAASPTDNPAALLSLAWFAAGGGQGKRDMVLLPYADRLELLSRYLQQLVMESIGKQHDRQGREVWQGIAVYGNKGSTDQHAYVQQLRDGLDNFFVTFIEVLDAGEGEAPLEVEPGITAGDFLHGFLEGTRTALTERGRPSLTIAVRTVDARTIGALIALFERAVGLYAELVDINAYHQPGVEAGKKAAARVLEAQIRVLRHLDQAAEPQSAETVAEATGIDDPEAALSLLRYLAQNERHRVEMILPDSAHLVDATFRRRTP